MPQATKVEIIWLVEPDKSFEALEELLRLVEGFYQRVRHRCVGVRADIYVFASCTSATGSLWSRLVALVKRQPKKFVPVGVTRSADSPAGSTSSRRCSLASATTGRWRVCPTAPTT